MLMCYIYVMPHSTQIGFKKELKLPFFKLGFRVSECKALWTVFRIARVVSASCPEIQFICAFNLFNQEGSYTRAIRKSPVSCTLLIPPTAVSEVFVIIAIRFVARLSAGSHPKYWGSFRVVRQRLPIYASSISLSSLHSV